MISLIQAELRKCWKTKKFIVAIVCFLCFMGCSYLFSIQRDNQYHQIESMRLGQQNGIAMSIFSQLKDEIQNTERSKEPPSLRPRFNLWKEVSEACFDYSNVRQAPEYFGWDVISKAAARRANALQALLSNKYYEDELKEYGVTIESVKSDVVYFNSLKENNLSMYNSIYEPTLINFFIQIFQNETMVLLIIISAFFLIDQLCQDFDYGTYKNIYITPKKRINIMSAKVISSMCMNVIAFFIAFGLFAFIPITQHGVGSFLYPYIINGQLLSFFSLFAQTIVLMMLVLLVYMGICILGAIKLKNTTNTLLLIAGIITFIYMCFKLFGMNLKLINWIPLFYFYPYEIISKNYSYPIYICIALCVISLIGMYVVFHKRIEHIDLEGSEAS